MASTDTISTVTTTTNTRTGIGLSVTTNTQSTAVGNFVTDASIQPYIASRIVSFYAYGLRPSTLVHIFFDSVLVDQYCAPGIVPTSIANAGDYNSIKKNGNWGDPIMTDAFGQVAGQFNIPDGTFKTGDRVLEIADTTNIQLSADAITTRASGTFTASNLSVTKQAVTLTTINPTVSVVPITETHSSNTTTTSIVIHPDIGTVVGNWYEPIAQGLTIITPSNEAGIFATSIDLFFKKKPPIANRANGITVYICEINNGYPDGTKIIPYSQNHLMWEDVVISDGTASPPSTFSGPVVDDSTMLPTRFYFDSPVFLNNNVEYAFIVKPDAGDPDYWVYSANLGDSDLVAKGSQFTSNPDPKVSTAFYGATDTEWTALQTEYIKFSLNRAKFTSANGYATFNNSNTDFLSVYNIGFANSSVGILVGDYVFQSTNSTVSTVNTQISGIVDYWDDVKEVLYTANSTGNFQLNTFIQIHRFANSLLAVTPGPNTATLIAYANTGSFYTPKVNAFVPQLSTITPAGTTLALTYHGTSNANVYDSQGVPVNIGTDTQFFDYERVVGSYSDPTYSWPTVGLTAAMTTDSELISPVVDLQKHQELIIGNNVDPIKFIYEEFFNTGSAKSKYVSKIVTLAPGQDSEDLQVIISAYRPAGSDIQVWVKFLNGEDGDPISAKTWTPLFNTSASLYSNPSDPTDFREFAFVIPQYYGMISTNGTITTTSACTVVNGVNTQFGTDVKVGWYINMLANSTNSEITRKVVSIANTTQLTLDSPFNSTYSANAYFVVSPPTTPWLSANTSTKINGLVSTSTTNNIITGFSSNVTANSVGVVSNALVISNANTYYSVGQQVSYVVPTSNTAIPGLTANSFYYIATANTTAISLNPQYGNTSPITLTPATTNPGEVHSIVSTNFTGQLKPGSIISINNDSQAVVFVTNATSLSVGKPWSSAVSAYPAYSVTPNGLSYLGSQNNIYSSYKQFQIKVILQSNDSSKIPLITNLRALALQL